MRNLLRASLSIGLLFITRGVLAATITVTSAADNTTVDSAVTLREAITSINNGADLNADVTANRTGTYGTSDTINFNIAGAGVHTITPASALPSITKTVLINGYSQPGASANTLAVGDNAVLLIEISGASTPLLTVFNILAPAGGVTVQGFVINRTAGGQAFLVSSSNNIIAGNFIGVDPTGTTLPDLGTAPVIRFADGSSNTFGGSTPAARNVMAGNGGGGGAFILLQGSGGSHVIQGNYIGTNASGTAILSNFGFQGVEVNNDGNTIGGTASGAGNVIAGANDGIFFRGSASTSNNVIQGNRIGTNAAGTAALGGTTGIEIRNSTVLTNNLIGGSSAGAGNLISGNGTGILVTDSAQSYTIQGNRIGTDVTGTLPIPNSGDGVALTLPGGGSGLLGGTGAGEGNIIAFNGGRGVWVALGTGHKILGNFIFSNGGIGIDLNNDGVTANDACDADTGANNLQNFPVITSVTSGASSTNIQGTLNSLASSSFRLEFFASSSCDPSGNGEGQTFLGSTTVTTDGSCNATFNVTVPVGTAGQVITVTATLLSPASGLPIETSEFSACFVQPVPTDTPTNTPTNTPTSTPTNTPTSVFTNTPTNTPTGTPTSTLTPIVTPAAAVVPTLSPSMLALLALALAAAAIFLFRRS